MATAVKWTNVAVAIQSAIGSALPITQLTKASTGVVTSAAHGLLDGDLVLIEAQGMHQVNKRVFRVDNKTNDTFELEGENTSAYDTFVSGNAYKLTMGTTLSTVTDVDASGGEFDQLDTSTIHTNQKTSIPGSASPSVFQFGNIWDPTDAGLLALNAASKAGSELAVKFTFGTGGRIMLFTAQIGASLIPTGSAGQVVKTPATLTAQGVPTYYAS
jgi:hypothetical protein